ncbi:MAG: hypothetical protein PWP15_50 [Methanothermococcus sp.]|uniref:hypothetical protein n=1 Tax=Methanothermococcus sp. TaxID=2614238 RepID=UPI0025900998|nr:hypothetical protein [Methanothermococcus sp.]MDK2789543.1 hypothetical protein [Methanothermococcus sp.]MDK2946438.1 hypothetical protein [Geotoga sp.]
MKLGLFVPTFHKDYNKVPASIWIRAFQMKKYYERLGVEVHINNFLNNYDVVIYYRGVSIKSYYIIKLLKKITKKIYWDQCVNYFEKHNYNTNIQVNVAKKISSIVDGIIVSTNFLKNKAKKLNENVFIMPDPIDLEKFRVTKSDINFDNPKFIWSGVSKKSVFLNKYSNDISGRIVLITDENIKNMSLKFGHESIKWTYQNFDKDILRGDICLAPRENFNNPYDLGHSSFKILVFASANMPIICNKLPSYVELSKIYGGIEFLEDNNNDINLCVENLKEKKFKNNLVKQEYSCEKIAKSLIYYLYTELENQVNDNENTYIAKNC